MSHYRPFTKKYFYAQKLLNDVFTNNHFLLKGTDFNLQNKIICYACNEQTPLLILAVDTLTDFNFCARTCTLMPLYSYSDGKRKENVSDWGLEQFLNYYKDKKISKEDVFYYAYSILHDTTFKKVYEMNLKRESPRIPLLNGFWERSEMGKKLMELHINYEKSKQFPLKIVEAKTELLKIKVKLKADRELGQIELDEITTIQDIPKEAWEYKLGNRSALEWILDQYKEKNITDTTIAEKFNTYHFADYKEHVIDLIKRVTTVSVETMKIVEEMKKENLNN